MSSESSQRQSIFPDVPRETPEVNKDGTFTDLWSLSFGALFQALQDNFKNEGIVFPGLTQDLVNTIQNLYKSYIGGSYRDLTLALPDISGQTIYNKTTQFTNQFVIAKDSLDNVTLAQWIPLSVMLTNIGNPNGAVAGVLNWLCYDSTGNNLYICTTSGSMTSAIWTLI
jgi:hypothetical protein